MKAFTVVVIVLSSLSASAQQKLTPELLWKLGRLNGPVLSKDKQYVYYVVNTPDVTANKFNKQGWLISINGGDALRVNNIDSVTLSNKISPDGSYIVSDSEVQVNN